MRFEIGVVGSVNTDYSVVVDRLPRPGETVSGRGATVDGGGKGANQAVAAARLGRRVLFGGAVGGDSSGRDRLADLAAAGIDISHVAVVDEPTGLALITVDAGGENTIAVAPGANRHLPTDVAARVGDSADVCLVQYEIPDDAVRAAIDAASLSIVNLAPYRQVDGVVGVADVIVVNEVELRELTGEDAEDPDSARAAAVRLGVPAVVVTLGGDGAVVIDRGQSTHVAAPSITPVDATGAGDAFCGGLADAVVRGESLADAVRWAVRVGATATLRRGAQAAMPRREEVVSA